MARFAPLVWAVPTTLAVLMLAKAALQPAVAPAPRAARAVPALVEQFDPPGRLHAPQDARPVTSGAKSDRLKVHSASIAGSLDRNQPADEVGPITAEEAERNSFRSANGMNAVPHEQPPAEILYPITEASDLPLMADAWPGTTRPGGPSQRLPLNPARAPSSPPAASPAASEPPAASDQALAAVRQQVAMMNQKAIKLALRGALYSARAELLEALRTVAQAKDAQDGTAQRTVALAAALTAMDESDDFARPLATQHASVPLADVVRPHQTPVLKRINVARLSHLTCSQHYFAYAQQQLSLAAGGDAAAAQTLYLLGKVHSHLAGESASSRSAHTARAIVFHQATLAIDPRHYQSANELGVLLARFGELAAARQMLLTSLTSHATPSAWHNLASVHDRLGETELARLARHEAQLMTGKSQRAADGPAVQWLDAATFAAQSPPAAVDVPSGKTVRAAAAAATRPRAESVRR